jgi:hypothetical protein
MDPDMVRQQEEAEAASRMPPPAPETSPLLATAQPSMEGYPFSGGTRYGPPGGSAAQPPQQSSLPRRGVWFAALLDTVLTVIGLSQGLKLGANLSLVPWQALAAGALGGYLLGWTGTGLWLRLRHRLSPLRSAAAAITPTAMILVVVMASTRLADRFWAIAPRPVVEALEDYPAGVLILSGGTLAAYLLALRRLWKSTDR